MDDLYTCKSSIGDEGIVCLTDKLTQEVSISDIVTPYRIVKLLGILDDLHTMVAFRPIPLLFGPDAFGYINNHHQNYSRDYDQPVQYQEGFEPWQRMPPGGDFADHFDNRPQEGINDHSHNADNRLQDGNNAYFQPVQNQGSGSTKQHLPP